ncbi:HD domain-containing protein [Rhizobium sp. CRIBSB]|nr:HD domain-containing protein [Rhizobium sp. CRIBSB]
MPARIRLAELIGALSHALDLTGGQDPGHGIRTAHIGSAIGRRLGLSEQQLHDLYYTLMLKDLGCSANAMRMSELFDTDDTSFKRDFKRVDGSLPSLLRQVFRHAGRRRGALARVGAVLKALSRGRHAAELVALRCNRGAEIAWQMRFSADVASGIRDLDEHFDGSGRPQGLKGEAIHLSARIALAAQILDVYQTHEGRTAALSQIKRRKGRWLDPKIADTLLTLAVEPGFWDDLAAPDLEEKVLAAEPGQAVIFADEDYIDDIVKGFARVIDAKSPYTAGHSDRVAEFTDRIAVELGLPPAERRTLRRAALLHDIGKLGVSARVLNKPAKLDAEEWTEMRAHAAHSERILSRIPAFAELAEIGGAHHERLDGSGYPRGLKGDQISFATRIIATADVFEALTGERPYRAALPTDDALEMIKANAGEHHDPVCVAALESALARKAQAAA